MRSLASLILAFVLSVPLAAVAMLTQAGVADAAFHCIRIHAVAGGVNGNNKVQFVELRMDVGFQTLLTGHTIQFFDAGGVLKATFTFPAGVANGAVGDSILIATSEFASTFTGGNADFIFSGANTTAANGGDALHPVQVPGGQMVWAGPSAACVTVMAPVDAAAYGGATAIYGTAAVALPNPGTVQALRLSNLNMAPTNNSAEYALANVSPTTFSVPMANLATDFSTPRNNARTVLTLVVPSVGGSAEAPVLPEPASATAAAPTAGGAKPWLGYGIAAVAAGALAGCAGWYAYRRRAA
jgi:hypothetical protein